MCIRDRYQRRVHGDNQTHLNQKIQMSYNSFSAPVGFTGIQAPVSNLGAQYTGFGALPATSIGALPTTSIGALPTTTVGGYTNLGSLSPVNTFGFAGATAFPSNINTIPAGAYTTGFNTLPAVNTIQAGTFATGIPTVGSFSSPINTTTLAAPVTSALPTAFNTTNFAGFNALPAVSSINTVQTGINTIPAGAYTTGFNTLPAVNTVNTINTIPAGAYTTGFNTLPAVNTIQAGTFATGIPTVGSFSSPINTTTLAAPVTSALPTAFNTTNFAGFNALPAVSSINTVQTGINTIPAGAYTTGFNTLPAVNTVNTINTIPAGAYTTGFNTLPAVNTINTIPAGAYTTGFNTLPAVNTIHAGTFPTGIPTAGPFTSPINTTILAAPVTSESQPVLTPSQSPLEFLPTATSPPHSPPASSAPTSLSAPSPQPSVASTSSPHQSRLVLSADQLLSKRSNSKTGDKSFSS
eukprot:TRINITY_DN7544_c0_g2_i3.p1 TRINITY_DN7544_c0_g2~~TRINITY_DN7544_c0_g2_i3.p1  ORF type:complete len:465 (+),score=86.86 TRINITY_DN7544_c0_g2_i3:66-1460(+)